MIADPENGVPNAYLPPLVSGGANAMFLELISEHPNLSKIQELSQKDYHTGLSNVEYNLQENLYGLDRKYIELEKEFDTVAEEYAILITAQIVNATLIKSLLDVIFAHIPNNESREHITKSLFTIKDLNYQVENTTREWNGLKNENYA